jgi:hypothetical protein
MKVASYALFGNHVGHGTRQFYWDHIPATVRAHHNLFPDWELRIHVDSTYHEDRSKLLRAYEKAGLLKVVHAEENIACCRSMLWRMMPVWEEGVTHVACRDLDSVPCAKDVEVPHEVGRERSRPLRDQRQSGPLCHHDGRHGRLPHRQVPRQKPVAVLDQNDRGRGGLEKPSGGYDQILMSNQIWGRYYPDVCAHRFSGMSQDSKMTACFDAVPAGPVPGLNPAMCALSDSLMPYLGTCFVPIHGRSKYSTSTGSQKCASA